MSGAASTAVSVTIARRMPIDPQLLARRLDLEADLMLSIGQHRAAERLSRQAEGLREEMQ